MTTSQAAPSTSQNPAATLEPRARFPGLRSLAWASDRLYASRGYRIVSGRILDQSKITWESVAEFRAEPLQRISVANRLATRLLRTGFHALAVLPSGGLVGAVAGAIVMCRPGVSEFVATHKISRGTRPLHV